MFGEFLKYNSGSVGQSRKFTRTYNKEEEKEEDEGTGLIKKPLSMYMIRDGARARACAHLAPIPSVRPTQIRPP